MPSQCFQTGFFVQSELISNYKPKPNPRFGTFSSLCLVINRGSDILPALTSRWQFESCWARGGKFLASAGTGYPSQPLCMRPPVDKEAHPPTAERTYPQTQTTARVYTAESISLVSGLRRRYLCTVRLRTLRALRCCCWVFCPPARWAFDLPLAPLRSTFEFHDVDLHPGTRINNGAVVQFNCSPACLAAKMEGVSAARRTSPKAALLTPRASRRLQVGVG